MKEQHEGNKYWWVPVIIIIVVVALLVYFLTLGKIDLSPSEEQKPEEEPESEEARSFREKKERAVRRHEKLRIMIERKKGLKKKLDSWFRWAYFGVRLVLVGMLVGFECVLYFGFDIRDIGTIMSWNEAVLGAFFILVFLMFRTLSNLEAVINYFKNRTENWIYGKYFNVEEAIINAEAEMRSLNETYNILGGMEQVQATIKLEETITVSTPAKEAPSTKSEK